MASEHDTLFRLPEAPAAAPARRQAAIANAMDEFEKKYRTRFQAPARHLRLMQQTVSSIPPSRRRTAMPRARHVIAASLVVLMAGSAVWLYVDEPRLAQQATPVLSKSDRLDPAPTKIIADRSGPSTVNTDPYGAGLVTPAAPPPPVMGYAPYPPRQEATADARTRSNVQGRIAEAPAMAAAPRVRSADGIAQYDRLIALEPMPPAEPMGRDRFVGAAENVFRSVRETPVSTFSIDVDTASYSFVRASLNRNVLPQPAAVRIEELINYFPYAYAAPASASEPFSTTVSVFPSPWSEGRKIIQIGIKGYALQAATRPRANLVFLIDTSGSMNAPNRMPLVKQSMAMLLAQLQPTDRVAIVTYAGNAGTALEPTAASEKAKILGVLERLEARGSTAGAEGIRQAYLLAEQNYDPNGVNRVILATDGDFNVGITSRDELKGFVERQRGKGIFLSILGFGMGNYNDALMQALAQNGNGAAAYIDTLNEARKVLVDEATSTLFPIAKDVKIQVEFNPATVAEYRLIGYETRLLNRDDFANDKVDAGDVGSGQIGDRALRDRPGRRPARGRRPALRRGHGPGRTPRAGDRRRRVCVREDPLQAAEVGREHADQHAGRSLLRALALRAGAGRGPLRNQRRGVRRDPARRPLHRHVRLRRRAADRVDRARRRSVRLPHRVSRSWCARPRRRAQ